eukprot:3559998-Rhodomonas_salina.1
MEREVGGSTKEAVGGLVAKVTAEEGQGEAPVKSAGEKSVWSLSSGGVGCCPSADVSSVREALCVQLNLVGLSRLAQRSRNSGLVGGGYGQVCVASTSAQDANPTRILSDVSTAATTCSSDGPSHAGDNAGSVGG